MKKIILGALTFSLSAVWAAPALGTEMDGACAGRDPSSSFVRSAVEVPWAPPGTTVFNTTSPWVGASVADGEQGGDLSSTESPELPCCEGEDVAEAQQCWDWQCAAGVVGGALNNGIVGAGIGAGAGLAIPGLGALPGAIIGGAAGLVGGGLIAYGNVPACAPPPSSPPPPPPAWGFGGACGLEEEVP